MAALLDLSSEDPLLFVMLLVLVGFGLLAVLVAPLLARFYHKRQQKPSTRRSMAFVTLAYAGLGVNPLCIGAAFSVHERMLSRILIIAGFLVTLAFPLLLMLAFPARPREIPTRRTNAADGAPSSPRS